MGMFDSVIVKCPSCQSDVEFQSKAGECVLDRLTLDSASPTVLADIAKDTVACRSCGSLVGIRLGIMSTVVVNGVKNGFQCPCCGYPNCGHDHSGKTDVPNSSKYRKGKSRQ